MQTRMQSQGRVRRQDQCRSVRNYKAALHLLQIQKDFERPGRVRCARIHALPGARNLHLRLSYSAWSTYRFGQTVGSPRPSRRRPWPACGDGPVIAVPRLLIDPETGCIGALRASRAFPGDVWPGARDRLGVPPAYRTHGCRAERDSNRASAACICGRRQPRWC